MQRGTQAAAERYESHSTCVRRPWQCSRQAHNARLATAAWHADCSGHLGNTRPDLEAQKERRLRPVRTTLLLQLRRARETRDCGWWAFAVSWWSCVRRLVKTAMVVQVKSLESCLTKSAKTLVLKEYCLEVLQKCRLCHQADWTSSGTGSSGRDFGGQG